MDYYNRARQFRAKKRLGQNFLIDPDIVEFIISQVKTKENCTVVEIGSGIGFVTEKLVKIAQKVYAIEIDEDAIKLLKKIPGKNLEIIHKDVLKVDFSAFMNENNEKITVVANIPYYITSPILVHLLGEIDDLTNKNRCSIDEIILMVQYEVAQRLVATQKSPSKQYGLLSVLASFFADVELLKKVSAKSFFPRPKVDSAIVRFKVREKPLLELDDYTFFRKVLKASFASRRKNIKNSLVNAGYDKNIVLKTLKKLDISENIRGETLSVKEFGELSKVLKENL